ncbi:MAG: decaprenyl-phosphate phosphoribosyltransferase [Planctomycetes bacterium]|nr:decaprenyl-phosphate phosphoribosyltransferase [Planctomycetota bacterium]
MTQAAALARTADTLYLVLVSMRPRQWLKNGFLFAALLFSQNLFHPAKLAANLFAFAVFCLASGAVYLLNDLLDASQDRRHPKKQSRPIASGALDPRAAGLACAAILPLSLLAGYGINGSFCLILAGYLAIQISYCLFVKHLIILDVFSIASGFVLRVAAGSVAIQVPMSRWLIICTIFVSLFLAVAKRRHELLLLGTDASNHRKVLEQYSVLFLDQMISIATAGTIVSYSLYTLSEETIAKFGTTHLWFTIPIVLYGISRYLYRVYTHHDGGQPEDLVWRDKPLLACVAVYVLAVVAILYLPSGPLS